MRLATCSDFGSSGRQLVGDGRCRPLIFGNRHFFIGNVGLDWQFSGVGNFSSVPGESDLLLRNRSTGALQVYNIANNQLTGSFSLGAVGADWKFAGVAPVSAPGASDLVLRNFNTGAFQAYNIAGN